ncbi:hypothetical protein BGZ68_003887 [Mortierella alpina]|nr:hypothetical protein BGZ68_003887 [Mortierella alpina]
MAIKKKVQFKNDDMDLVSVSLNDMDHLPFYNEDMDGRDYKDTKDVRILDKNQVDPEPADSNSMEPSLSAISAPVAQPPPLHCNTSPHRHSSVPLAMSEATLTDKTQQHLPSSSSATTTTAAAATPSFTSPSSISADSAPPATTFPKNATTTVEFVLESPDFHAIEMQHFGNRSDKTQTVLETHPSVPQVSPPEEAHSEQPSLPPAQSNFFTGWFTIPPSLAGRPRLTQQQEAFVKREFERGPVPLMWPKEADLESQSRDWRNDTTPVHSMKNGLESTSSVGSGWFRSWGFGSSSKDVEARTEGAMAQ